MDMETVKDRRESPGGQDEGGRGWRRLLRGALGLETDLIESEVLLLLFGGSATKFTQGSSNGPDKDLSGSVVLENPRISVSTCTLL